MIFLGMRKKSPYKNADLSRQLSLDAVARNSVYEDNKDQYDDYIKKSKQAYEVKQKNKSYGLYDMDEDLNRASNPYHLYDLLDILQVKYDKSRSDLQKKLENENLTPDEKKTKLDELEKSYNAQKSTAEKKLKEIVKETAQSNNAEELLGSYKEKYEKFFKKSKNEIEFNEKLMAATSVPKKTLLLNELEKNYKTSTSALQENLEKATESGDIENIKDQKKKLENEYSSQKNAVKKELKDQLEQSYDQYSYDTDTRIKNQYNSYGDNRYQRQYSAYDDGRYYSRQPSRGYY